VSSAVLAGFEELLHRLELTPDQQTKLSTSQEYLRSIIAEKFSLGREPILIGSYARYTQIRMDRDIDLLVVLADDPHWPTYQRRSSALVSDLRKAIKASYPKTKLSNAGIAVVMDMEVLNFDVVPAFASEDHFVIPNGDGGWQATNPLYHINLMEAHNKLDNRLKPLVKILKFWNQQNDSYWQSFHLEMATERIWRGRTIADYPGAVATSLVYLRALLEVPPFANPWSAGERLDGYLWALRRLWAKQRTSTDAATAVRAEGLRLGGREEEALSSWHSVFGGGFPNA
jgi:predicted nucleotidyltransferase